ncbi:hypothetical protein CANCADRAFT_55 [Tortispora caseinolytica NRRL Y-17796]|uniref:Uncharacterized protein n=1 Tax=Tortispora caseinolytica NRRL Y-17796 TaxID=767744 RepID=A0A1E4TID0_9ASCO|nr:hypothetical protein CANCADRAFT_55 [Tortispora caseinolytica NRRL Y-17796]
MSLVSEVLQPYHIRSNSSSPSRKGAKRHSHRRSAAISLDNIDLSDPAFTVPHPKSISPPATPILSDANPAVLPSVALAHPHIVNKPKVAFASDIQVFRHSPEPHKQLHVANVPSTQVAPPEPSVGSADISTVSSPLASPSNSPRKHKKMKSWADNFIRFSRKDKTSEHTSERGHSRSPSRASLSRLFSRSPSPSRKSYMRDTHDLDLECAVEDCDNTSPRTKAAQNFASLPIPVIDLDLALTKNAVSDLGLYRSMHKRSDSAPEIAQFSFTEHDFSVTTTSAPTKSSGKQNRHSMSTYRDTTMHVLAEVPEHDPPVEQTSQLQVYAQSYLAKPSLSGSVGSTEMSRSYSSWPRKFPPSPPETPCLGIDDFEEFGCPGPELRGDYEPSYHTPSVSSGSTHQSLSSKMRGFFRKQVHN